MNKNTAKPINIGLIFSTTGTTSIIEEGQLQACLLAIDEVNSHGRLHFRAVIEDIQSNPQVAAEKAQKLLEKDQVDLLVGCWTSACRKAVLPVLEETGGLLLYPNNYEGQESHPQVFYLGAVPNQQVESILSWIVGNLASRFVLLGSDYIYPRSANQQVRQWVERIDPQMIALERYFPLGHSDFANCLDELRPLLDDGTPTVIFSNLVGSSVVDFYRQYHQAGFRAPIISPITSEREIAAIGPEAASGHYCTSGYFQSLNNAENQQFVSNYTSRFGETTVSGAMEFSYAAIRMLEQAYDEELLTITDGTKRNNILRERLRHMSLEAPQGKLIVDPQNQHLWLWSRIGRIRPNGQIEIVWSSPGPIPPYPFNHENEPKDTGAAVDLIDAFTPIIGSNHLLQEKIRIAKVAARTRSNVLIEGENGCGKRLFAKAIQQGSILAGAAFVEQDCRLPEEELAEQLFGNPETHRRGNLERANHGTLLLQHICEIPLSIQQRLLDMLQAGHFRCAGENQLRPLQIRIIATTNRDLLQEIAFNGTFISSLYDHLAVFNLHLPPLRDHSDDIPRLAANTLERINRKNETRKELSSEALTALGHYSWPGNVRELTNILERAYYLSLEQGIIRLEHLPGEIIRSHNNKSQTSHSDQPLEVSPTPEQDTEKSEIEKAIRKTDYNMSLAAKELGIARSTLYRKIEKYGIKLKAEIVSR